MPDLATMKISDEEAEDEDGTTSDHDQQDDAIEEENDADNNSNDDDEDQPAEEETSTRRRMKHSDSAYKSSEIEQEEIDYRDLEFGKKVGSGGFKQVFKVGRRRGWPYGTRGNAYRCCFALAFQGRHLEQTVAIGVISTDALGEDDLKDLENEMQVMQ